METSVTRMRLERGDSDYEFSMPGCDLSPLGWTVLGSFREPVTKALEFDETEFARSAKTLEEMGHDVSDRSPHPALLLPDSDKLKMLGVDLRVMALHWYQKLEECRSERKTHLAVGFGLGLLLGLIW